MTTIVTLRQRRRNVLEFITEACSAHLTSAATLSFVPDRAHAMLVAA